MYRPRNKRSPIVIREITERQQKVLTALERYDHLDTKHLSLITGLSLKNIELPLRTLFDAGLVERPPNNKYRRDRLKDPQVHRRTYLGTDWLQRHDLLPHRAVHRAAGASPSHDLAVSQLGVCIELAHKKAGLRFITIDEIVADLPDKTIRFKTDHGNLVPDLIFSTEYPDEYRLSFVEVNLSDHGDERYERKQSAYRELIFAGIYKNQLGMQQKARVLNFDTSTATLNLLLKHTEDRDPFYFKLLPSYGQFEVAPPPVENILENWRDLKGHIINLGAMHERTGKANRPVHPTGEPQYADSED